MFFLNDKDPPSLHERLSRVLTLLVSCSCAYYSAAETDLPSLKCPRMGWDGAGWRIFRHRFSRFVYIGKINWTGLLVLELYYIPQLVLR